MVQRLINKYIWLLRTIVKAGSKGVTMERLAELYHNRWDEDYSRSTFNHHRTAIEDIFGIKIDCDRSTNSYYIKYSADATNSDESREWLINTFTVNNLLTLSKERLSGRVSVENIPSGHKYLTDIMEAMTHGNVLEIKYKKYTSSDTETLTVRPYALKEHDRRWYLVGYCEERRGMRNYGLDRILSIKELDMPFAMPSGFDVDSLFAESYGAYLPSNEKAVDIVFKASGKDISYITDLPIHPSQRNDGNGIFTIHVIPNDSLEMKFCSFAGRIEVLAPESFRNAICKRLEAALNDYKTNNYKND